MANLLQSFNQRWVILTKRDRMMLFLVGLFGVVGLMDTYVTDPVRQQTATAEEELVKLQADTAKVQVQITKLNTAVTDANSPIQQQISQLKADIASQEQALLTLGSMMVKPQQMAEVMKKLLKQHADVQVVAMESLPPVSFVKKHLPAADASAGAVATAPEMSLEIGALYQHTLRLKLSGAYLPLMHYVADLKAQGNSIAWENADFKASYPQAELTLELYTLGTDQAWLGI